MPYRLRHGAGLQKNRVGNVHDGTDCFNIGWEMFTMAPDWFNIGLEMFMSDYYGQNSLVFLISKLSLVYAVSQW